jgi:hypothetical protein
MAEMLSREELLADLEEFRELDSGRRRETINRKIDQ